MKKHLILAAVAAILLSPPAAYAKRYNLDLSFGQDVLVVGKDDVGLRVQCLQNQGGNDVLRLYAVTANDAVSRGAYGSYNGDGSYLTPVTPAISSTLGALQYPTGTEVILNNTDAGGVLNLTTMHGYTLNVESAVFALNAAGSDCLFSIDVSEVKKFKQTF